VEKKCYRGTDVNFHIWSLVIKELKRQSFIGENHFVKTSFPGEKSQKNGAVIAELVFPGCFITLGVT
jgi:hypothetical protein